MKFSTHDGIDAASLLSGDDRLPTPRQILIADASVQDLDTLLDGLSQDVEAWLVQPGDNAMDQIGKAMAVPGLTTLHLLAHGGPGEIRFGARAIHAHHFSRRFDGATTRDLDIAFWSCRTGADAAGQHFIESVANATGARVAAADGLIGQADKGGSWTLSREVSVPFNHRAQRAFNQVLIAHPIADLIADIPVHALWTIGDIITVDGTATVAQVNQLAAVNTGGSLVAAISDATAAALITLSDGVTLPGTNAYTVVLTDATVAATDLTTIDKATSLAVGASAVSAITGTAAELAAVAAEIGAGTIIVPHFSAAPTTVATVAQVLAIGVAKGSGTLTLPNGVSDTAEHFAAADGTIDAALRAILKATNANTTFTDTATVAQAIAVWNSTDTGGLALTNGVTDSAANFVAVGGAMDLNLAMMLATTHANTRITDGATVAQVNGIVAANGSGTITATISDATASGLKALVGTHAYTIQVADVSVAAADLTAIDNATSLPVDVSAVKTITGTAEEIAALNAELGAGTIAGFSGAFLTGPHPVNGTIAGIASPDVLADLQAVGDRAVVITSTTVAATSLSAIDALTSLPVDATAVTVITGTAAQLAAVAEESRLGTLTTGQFSAAPTTPASVLQANSIVAQNGGGILTATISDGDAASLTALSGTHAYTIAVTDPTVAATALTAIDHATSLPLDARAVTTLTGTAGEIAAIAAEIGAGTIILTNFSAAPTTPATVAQVVAMGVAAGTGTLTLSHGVVDTALHFAAPDGSMDAAVREMLFITNADTTITDGATVVQVNSIAATNGNGTITATISDTTASTLKTLTGTHAYTIKVGDASVAAADLTAIDGATSLAVDASAVSTITGSAEEMATLAAELASGTIVGFGSVPVGGTVAGVPSLDVLADLRADGNRAVVITDTAVGAASLSAIDALATLVVNATSVSAITGTAAQLAAVADESISGTLTTANFSAAPTTVATVSQVLAIDTANGNGTLTLPNGIADTAIHYASVDGTMETAISAVLTATNADTTITDAATVAQARAVWSSTPSGLLKLPQGIADTAQHYAAADGIMDPVVTGILFSTKANAVFLDAATVAQVNSIAAIGTGATITARISEGTAGSLQTLSGSHPYTITVTDTEVAATALTAIDNATSLPVDAGAVGTITGTAEQLAAVAAKIGAGTITSAHFSATPTTVTTVAQATAIGLACGSGTLTLTNGVSDTAEHFANTDGLMDAPLRGILFNANANATITDTTTVAQALAVWDSTRTGTLALTTGIADSAAHYVAIGAAMDPDLALMLKSTHANTIVTDGTTVAQANSIAANDDGSTITATISEGGAASLATLTGLHAYTIKVTDKSVAATDLSAIDNATSVAVDATAVTTLSGTATTLLAALHAPGIALAANYNVTVFGAIDAADLAAIDLANGTGSVTSDSTRLSAPNTFVIETPVTPAWTVSNAMVASVIDSAGAQTIHIAAGGKLNLSGSDGHNVIVFDASAPGSLEVSHDGTTAIFTDHVTSTQIASIATDLTYAPSQTIIYSDGSSVELTLVGSVMAFNGVTVSTLGSIV